MIIPLTNEEINIKISQTEDYCIFNNELNKTINDWKSEKKYPKKSIMSGFLDSNPNRFYLWGKSGSGKTVYLEIWKNNKDSIKEIKKLSEIENEGIYLFDGVNESSNFSEEELETILKNKKIFILYSGWYSSKKNFGHNINPSEEIIRLSGWDRFKEFYEINEYFSIREKYLMCSIKNFDKIKKEEKHSLIWKAFENIMTSEYLYYYKKIIKKSPTSIEKESNDEFRYLLKKNIIQWNDGTSKFIYSHPNIVAHLYLRNHVKEIKALSFESDTTINLIKANPTQFIWWCLQVNKDADIIFFFKENNILISVEDHQLIDEKLDDNEILYSKLTFNDLKILSNKEKYQRVYIEYLQENIDTNKILNSDDLYEKDIAYFVYSIISPIRNGGDDLYPCIMNSMKKSGFEKNIKWNNENNRNRMLNYILGRYIQGYIDDNFSSLEVSELSNIIFSNWDHKNKLKFYDFIKKCWDEIKHKSLEKDASYFDNIINYGKGRTSILDNSFQYKKMDERFQTSRNTSENGIFFNGHRSVNYWMYLKFEDTKQYGIRTFYSEKNISDIFEKFMILFLNRYIYHFKNEPVYIDKFDYNIKTLPKELQQIFIKNKIKKLYSEIKIYLSENKNLISLEWDIDKIISKNRSNYIWIRNYESYSIYDNTAPENSILQAQDIYDSSGTKYVIKDGQTIILSNKKKFDKFIISYRLEDLNKEIDYDASFIIDFNNKDEKLETIEYEDITSWHISDDEIVEKEYEKNENEILNIIKTTTSLDNF